MLGSPLLIQIYGPHLTTLFYDNNGCCPMHTMWLICREKVFCLHTSNKCVITLNLHSEGYGQNYCGCGQIDSDSTSSNWKIIKLAGNRFICMFCTSFKWFKCRFCHAYHLQNKSNTGLTLHNSLKNVVNDGLKIVST